MVRSLEQKSFVFVDYFRIKIPSVNSTKICSINFLCKHNNFLVFSNAETATGSSFASAPDLDGGEPGAQAWWEAPCADTKCLGRG